MIEKVKIQVELSNKANAIVSYEKARRGLKTKAEVINLLLEGLEEEMK